MNDDVIKDFYVKPDLDTKTVELSFIAKPEFSHCRISVSRRDEECYESSQAIMPGTFNCLKFHLEDVFAWSPASPELYVLKFELLDYDNGESHEIRRDFGFCKLQTDDKWFYLNNDKFYPRAYIRGREAHEHPNLMGLPLEDFYRKNIKAAKDYGFNMVRFHSRIPDDTFLQAADELGIFVHVELRKYYGKYQKEGQMMSDEGEILDRNLWVDTIKQLRNHPCVFSYCMGNEIRNPGSNPFAQEIAELTRDLDPAKLFIDTCAHGEYDRDYVDFDVQHMSYYFPYGKNYDMFEHTYNWTIYGSCKGNTLEKEGDNYKLNRALHVDRPVIAHEICHYVAMRDLEALEEKFAEYCPDKTPWWLEELKKLVALKGMEEDYPRMLEASRDFQFICWKLGVEAVRRSSLLSGFHFLQLADTERYENCNGLLDCFDDKKGFSEEKFLRFNAETVLLADLPERTFFEGQDVSIPIFISHFGDVRSNTARLTFAVSDPRDKTVMLEDSMENMDISESGIYDLCRLDVCMPATEHARELYLTVKLEDGGRLIADNSWGVWLFADQPEVLEGLEAQLHLEKYRPLRRYPGLQHKKGARLLLADRFDDEVLEHLKQGKDVLMLYRVDETRARLNPDVDREEYCLPTTWDRFKGVIWDRGTNCGAFIRKNEALDKFPHGEFINLQFHRLIDDCDKVCLDDFPVDIAPVIQGVDKAARDRFDVYTYSLSELQPEWTLRKFAYLFELKVGEGRLLVTGFNFKGLEEHQPAVCGMFESLMDYVTSDNFKPEAEISPAEFEQYLRQKAEEPRVKERKMTQFWQLNNTPLESDKYWQNAERWIEGKSLE